MNFILTAFSVYPSISNSLRGKSLITSATAKGSVRVTFPREIFSTPTGVKSGLTLVSFVNAQPYPYMHFTSSAIGKLAFW